MAPLSKPACLLWVWVSCTSASAQDGAAACNNCSVCQTHCPPTLPSPMPPAPGLPIYGAPPPPHAQDSCPPSSVVPCCQYPPPSPYTYLPHYNYSSSPPSTAPRRAVAAASMVLSLAAPLFWTAPATWVVPDGRLSN